MAEFVTRSELRNVFDQEISKLQKKVKELQKEQNIMSRRQTRLRGDFYGTDDHPDFTPRDEPGAHRDENGAYAYLAPNQPSVIDHIHRVERLVKGNKLRSEKNEKKLAKSLESRAKRFFGFGKQRLHEELRF